METIEVLTGQHITLEYKPASILQRMGALLFDALIQGVYVFILFIFLYSLSIFDIYTESTAIILFFIVLLPVLTYHFFFEWLWSGQTPGKKVLNIKVTNEDGSATRVGAYFLRWLLRPVDMLFYGGVGALVIMLSKKHQRLGDLAAATVVVQTNPGRTALRNDYYVFPPNYEPHYPQVTDLSKGQIRFIQQTLATLPSGYDPAAMQQLEELARKVCSRLQVAPKSVDSRRFLEDIVRDYNYYESLGI